MQADDMKLRTKKFALNVMKLVRTIPKTNDGYVIARQLVRCGTSVGANYRAACLARSTPDFVSKLGIVAEEADESKYWMELLTESGLCKREEFADMMREAAELTSIIIASIKTARFGNK